MTRPALQPVFAVVGHPNKGKSSIVAALARDDRIAISPRSGTTERAEVWIFENSGGSYRLVDTPGFQRPRAVLEWLRQHAGSAEQRARAVAAFVDDPDCRARFPDETELLRPIVQGAAILYVVDGSRPYSPDYEAEMEILRWSGQPSMALANPIEGQAHVEEWEQALQQYFRLVRVFDPMQPRPELQARLLQAFAHLQPAWHEELEAIARAIEEEPEQRLREAAGQLALWLDEACNLKTCSTVKDRALKPATEKQVKNRYREQLVAKERATFERVLQLFGFSNTDLEICQLQPPARLLDEQQWQLWGLSPRTLYSSAFLGGAGAGALIGWALPLHGHIAGAAIGGLAGLYTAWLGNGKLEQTRLSRLAGGCWQVCAGPLSDRNFPFVLIGRFGWLLAQLERRSHARREAIRLEPPDWKPILEDLDEAERKALFKACERLSKQKTVDNLQQVLLPVLRRFRNTGEEAG